MSSSAPTPAAGTSRPVWPARPAPSARPGPAGRPTDTPTRRAPQDRTVPSPVPPAARGPHDTSGAHPFLSEDPTAPPAGVPAEEQALDPRGIARASLAAGRNRSLWWTLTGVAAAGVATFVWGAVVGSFALAALLLVYAVVRAVGGPTGPPAVTVRSKPLDVAILLAGATALIVLASVLPPA